MNFELQYMPFCYYSILYMKGASAHYLNIIFSLKTNEKITLFCFQYSSPKVSVPSFVPKVSSRERGAEVTFYPIPLFTFCYNHCFLLSFVNDSGYLSLSFLINEYIVSLLPFLLMNVCVCVCVYIYVRMCVCVFVCVCVCVCV